MASNRSRFGVVTSDPFTCISQIEGDDVSSDDDSVDVLDLEDSDTSSLSSYAESDEEENDNASTSNSGWTRLQQPSRNFVNFPFTVSQPGFQLPDEFT